MSATTDTTQEETTAGREIVTARRFDAPREAVFRAFADPDLLARWWGPEGFTNTFHEFDLRPGGAWRLVMRGPDGAEYAMTKEFLEVVPPERVVLRHPQPMHSFNLTLDFADEAGATRLTWRMVFDSVAEADAVRDVVVRANEQNLDRLAAQLAATARGDGGR